MERYVFACRIFMYDIVNGKLKSKFLGDKLVWNNSRLTQNSDMIKVPTFTNSYIVVVSVD